MVSRHRLGTFFLFVSFTILFSCSKEEATPSGEGYFTYDGSTYNVDEMYIEKEYTHDDGFGVYSIMITKGFEVTKTSVKGSGNAIYLQVTQLYNSNDFLGAFELNTDRAVSGARMNSSSSMGFDIYFSAGSGEIYETDNGYFISFTFIERQTSTELAGTWTGMLSTR